MRQRRSRNVLIDDSPVDDFSSALVVSRLAPWACDTITVGNVCAAG